MIPKKLEKKKKGKKKEKNRTTCLCPDLYDYIRLSVL